MNKHFSKEDTKMINMHMKRCSISISIRKIQIKNKRSQFTLTKMAVIKKTDNKYWQGCGEIVTFIPNVQHLWKMV